MCKERFIQLSHTHLLQLSTVSLIKLDIIMVNKILKMMKPDDAIGRKKNIKH